MKRSDLRQTAALLILLLTAITLLQLASSGTRAQTNSAPELSTPTSTSLYLVFPKAAGAALEFPGEPATDADADPISYHMTFEGTVGVQDTAFGKLLVVAQDGFKFHIRPKGGVTPEEFGAAYGAGTDEKTINGVLHARDSNGGEDSLTFTITAIYEGSAQFHEAAVHSGQQTWTIEEPYEIYEGTNTTSQQIPWSSSTGGDRNWQAGAPTGVPLQCVEARTLRPPNLVEAAYADSLLFETSGSTTGNSGVATFRFTTAPDYESAADANSDNRYLVGISNEHELHDLEQMDGIYPEDGCNGSMLILTVVVKDVGPPRAPGNLTGSFQSDNPTEIDLAWDETTTFEEEGRSVPFPDSSLATTKYLFQYRESPTHPWSGLGQTTGNSIQLRDLTGTGYIARVKGVNAEGSGKWATVQVGDYTNTPPTATDLPATEYQLVLPHGQGMAIKYSSAPATDSDEDSLSFSIALLRESDNEVLDAEAIGLRVYQDGNTIHMVPAREITPEMFKESFKLPASRNRTTVRMNLAVDDGASRNTLVSAAAVKIVYDPSAYFGETGEYAGNQRYIAREDVEVYEGVAETGAGIPWSGSMTGTRDWGLASDSETFTCRQEDGTLSTLTWPASGNEDNARLSLPKNQTNGASGAHSPRFLEAPDYENPVDSDGNNSYRIRLHNKHNLHIQTEGDRTPGCSGSALDLTIRIKDVGPPGPMNFTAAFAEDEPDTIQLTWTPPTTFVENGRPVELPSEQFHATSYEYRYRPEDSQQWSTVRGNTGNTAAITAASQAAYQIEMSARSSEGIGSWSGTKTVRRAVPGVPRNLTARPDGVAIEAAWDPPAAGGPAPSHYVVRLTNTRARTYAETPVTSGTTARVEHLDRNTTYEVQVAGANNAGTGKFTTKVTITTHQVPGEPTNIRATTTRNSAAVSWDPPPDDGGTPITKYTVQIRETGAQDLVDTATGPSETEALVRRLTEGTEYHFSVAASNKVGQGPFPAERTFTTKTTPSAPGQVQAVAGITSISLTWTAPGRNGGAPVTGYTARLREKDNSAWTQLQYDPDTHEARFAGLSANTLHQYQVAARNSLGTGGFSPLNEIRTRSPLPTPTPTPTPAPTEPPDPSDDEDPAAAPTIEPTAEATPEPTPQVIPTQIPAPTPKPIQNPEPTPDERNNRDREPTPTVATATPEPLDSQRDDVPGVVPQQEAPTATPQPAPTPTPRPTLEPTRVPLPTIVLSSMTAPATVILPSEFTPTPTPTPTPPPTALPPEVEPQPPQLLQPQLEPTRPERPSLPLIGDALPRLRSTLEATWATTRQRTTLVLAMATALLFAGAVFGYLLLRRR